MALVFIPLTITMLVLAFGRDPESEKHLVLLSETVTQTPVHPTFQQKGLRKIAGRNRASIYLNYQVTAKISFDEVKGFYVRELTVLGWSLADEEKRSYILIFPGETRRLIFRKGIYQMSIFWDDSAPEKFDITYVWYGP